MRAQYDLNVDVWAYGCVLTCLYTDSHIPYPPVARRADGSGVLSSVMRSQLAPSLPAHYSMHGFVRDCCQHSPDARPSLSRPSALE